MPLWFWASAAASTRTFRSLSLCAARSAVSPRINSIIFLFITHYRCRPIFHRGKVNFGAPKKSQPHLRLWRATKLCKKEGRNFVSPHRYHSERLQTGFHDYRFSIGSGGAGETGRMMRKDHIADDTECFPSLHREMWKRFSRLNQSNVHGFALIFYQSRHFVERWWMFFNRIISSASMSMSPFGLKNRTTEIRILRVTRRLTLSHISRFMLGRLFWKSVVCMFAVCVVEISRGQWQRYQMHPTMISLETNYGDWMYRYPAVTMCSNYTDAQTTIDVVQRYIAKKICYNSFVSARWVTERNCVLVVCGTSQVTMMHSQCAKRSRRPLQPPPGSIWTISHDSLTTASFSKTLTCADWLLW